MMRFVRAFFIALKMTLRGEKPPALSYQPLIDWIEQGKKLADDALAAAEKGSLMRDDPLTLKIDGREQTIRTVLSAVHYHLSTEYPYMLRHLTQHSITAIYASNLNDQYAVASLRENERVSSSPAARAIAALSDHLNAIPPSAEMDAPPESGQ